MGGGEAVQVDAQGEALGAGQPGQGFFQQNGIGAQIDMFAPVDQLLQQLKDRGINQRLAAGDGNHRGAAFLHGPEALLQGQRLPQGITIFLDAAAALAGQIALMAGLQHEHQGKLLLPLEALFHEVAG